MQGALVSAASVHLQEHLARIDLCALDDLQLVTRTLGREAAAWHELIRRYTSTLREAARDADERLTDADIEAVVAELWRSLTADEMRALRAFTTARGARFLSWVTVRLVRLVFARLEGSPDASSDEIPRAGQPTLMRVEDVAQRWSLDRKTIYSMISRGQLAARRCGRLVRIPRNVVESFELQASASSGRRGACR
jgi:excisionase family DNA binding protein